MPTTNTAPFTAALQQTLCFLAPSPGTPGQGGGEGDFERKEIVEYGWKCFAGSERFGSSKSPSPQLSPGVPGEGVGESGGPQNRCRKSRMNQQTVAAAPTNISDFKRRARELVAKLSLEEKIAQLIHNAPAIPRIGVPEYNWWNECLHGVARAGKATVFPQSIGMAATFDAPLIHCTAEAISDEARAKHHAALAQDYHGQYFGLTYWTPNINIFRDPRWGRGQETYGEDPYLTSRMGVAFVKGLQGDHPKYLKLVATPKHYAVHSGPEPQRHSFNAIVSQRDLRETYLPAFKACVIEGKAASVMGAYNRVNGEPACGSPTLLQQILRDEWGFDGFVVSDCGGICDFHLAHKVTANAPESAALALKNGCELNCGVTYPHLRAAVQAGLIKEEEIDLAAERLMTARMRLGMFDPPEQVPYASIPPDVVNCPAHRELALKVARESIVLLKNQNHLLPLRKSLKSIAVVGPTAYSLDALHGNYTGFAPQMTTLLQGILDAVPIGTQVSVAKGCEVAGNAPVNKMEIEWTVADADVIIACLGYTPALEGEEAEAMGDAQPEGGGDRMRIGLPGRQLELLQKLHATGKPVVLVLTGGSPIELNWAAANISSILMCWYPGELGGRAVADVLFGDYNPAGRLPVTFVRSLDQVPAFDDYNMAGRTYRFMRDEPLYQFGFGMSYTSFKYSNPRLSTTRIRPDQSVEVSVDVTNTGQTSGDEVVQLYITDEQSSVPTPRLHLEGFRRIHLNSGQTQTVSFTLHPDQLAAYDDDGKPFVEPGKFILSLGGGQPSDPASGAVKVELIVEKP
jgi:beta-glucosidase